MDRKKIIICKLGIVLLCMLVASVYYIHLNKQMFEKYPQKQISAKQLYGKNSINLKDFNLQKDGSLFAVTGDPWITMTWTKPVNVKTVSVYVAKVGKNTKGTCADVFIGGENRWEQQSYEIKKGVDVATFLKKQDTRNVKEMRFDLVSFQGGKIQIDKIVLNSHQQIKIQNATQVILRMVIVMVLMLQGLQGIEIWMKEGNKRYALLKFMILAFEMYALYFLYYHFIKIEALKEYKTWLILCSYIVIININLCEYIKVGYQKSTIKILEIGILFMDSALLDFGITEVLSGIPYRLDISFTSVLNYAIFLEIILILYMLFRSVGVALLLSNGLILVLGMINHYYYVFRGESFELADAKMVGTAGEVISGYHFEISKVMILIFLLELIYVMMCLAKPMIQRQKKNKKIMRATMVQLIVVMSLIGLNLPPVGFWNISDVSSQNGYLLSFFSYIKEMKISKPVQYSAKKVDEILEKENVQNGQNKESPNVIVIMNESFVDLPEIYHFDTQVDTLPFIHSLNENTIKGNLLVSVFGGTTANSEYEFLTGNSMAFMPKGTVPYVGYIHSKQQSFAWHLKENGYSIQSYHPFEPNGYRRETNYPLLGLSPFYSIRDKMPYKSKVRDYISDESDIKNVIDIYKKRDTSKPFFLFNVTMQNHAGYSADKSSIDVSVYPKDKNLQYPGLLEYLSLIHDSDAAFGELVNYFKSQKEPTVILMFGDHQPGLEDKIYKQLNTNLEVQNQVAVNVQQAFTTSFVIWANYDVNKDDNQVISTNYLESYLEKKAGLPMSAYDKYLIKLREKYPLINMYGYENANHQWNEMGVQKEKELFEYEHIIYNNMFDKSHMNWNLYK